eukprot:354828-Chlamydomonas_euryale.AAC.1
MFHIHFLQADRSCRPTWPSSGLPFTHSGRAVNTHTSTPHIFGINNRGNTGAAPDSSARAGPPLLTGSSPIDRFIPPDIHTPTPASRRTSAPRVLGRTAAHPRRLLHKAAR